MGYSPWDCKELDMTESHTHTHTHHRVLKNAKKQRVESDRDPMRNF